MTTTTNPNPEFSTSYGVEYYEGVSPEKALEIRPTWLKAVAFEKGSLVFETPLAAHIWKHRRNVTRKA
jgi:hypothetical protein